MLVIVGFGAIRITMIIGALTFSFVVALMGIAIVNAIGFDLIRQRHGDPTTAAALEGDSS